MTRKPRASTRCALRPRRIARCPPCFRVAIYSALRKAPAQAGLIVLGDLSIQSNIKPVRSLAEPLQVAMDDPAGEVKIGEGVMSLRRAFRSIGAQTVLASQWKMSDKATRQLMTEFVGRWGSGELHAKAWREAQLSLRHSKEFASLYFWAAFTLTGQWN